MAPSSGGEMSLLILVASRGMELNTNFGILIPLASLGADPVKSIKISSSKDGDEIVVASLKVLDEV